MEYRIERLNQQNLNHVALLHFDVYGKIVDPAFFEAKYDTAYTGVQHTGFIAFQGDLAIAFYGVIPCYLWCNGQQVLSAQSADTMTHPQYRNQGLFVMLAQQTFALCKYEGIKIIFGFPNQHSLPGFRDKLGFEVPASLDRFIIPLAPPGGIWSRAFSWLKRRGNYQRRILKKYALNNDGLTGSVLSDGYGGVYRNRAYLHYKTYSDTQVIHIEDALLWVKLSHGLTIGDMELAQSDYLKVIAGLKALGGRLGINQLMFQASAGTRLHALFVDHFEATPSFPVIFKTLDDSVCTDQLKFTFADIDIF